VWGRAYSKMLRSNGIETAMDFTKRYPGIGLSPEWVFPESKAGGSSEERLA